MEFYEKDGKIAILISPGFGAGWSTWDGDPSIAYDKRVVEFWLSHKDDWQFMHDVSSIPFRDNPAIEEIKQFFHSIGYDHCPYMGGFDDIVIKWVEPDTLWRINEYDGSEDLEIFSEAGFISFEELKKNEK